MVRADVNEELKLLWKCKKNISGVGVEGWSIGRRLVGSNVVGRGDVGYGGCEPRIEGIVQCTA